MILQRKKDFQTNSCQLKQATKLLSMSFSISHSPKYLLYYHHQPTQCSSQMVMHLNSNICKRPSLCVPTICCSFVILFKHILSSFPHIINFRKLSPFLSEFATEPGNFSLHFISDELGPTILVIDLCTNLHLQLLYQLQRRVNQRILPKHSQSPLIQIHLVCSQWQLLSWLWHTCIMLTG